MSDDGYPTGGYSPYSDDFDDFLYDADATPDLADELASHALQSPIPQDMPGAELEDYTSDWDYYSDDYYDDDPAILKKNPQDGSPISRKLAGDEVQKRGKKRKLADLQDIPELDLGERRTLRDCMRGTVWAKATPERGNIFSPGSEDRIALLKDWKKVFGTTSVQDKTTGNLSLAVDESWAKDMSLADMGLTNERGNRTQQGSGEGGEEIEEDADQDVGIDEETAAVVLQQMEDLDEDQAVTLMQKLRRQTTEDPSSTNIPPPQRKQHPLSQVYMSSPPSEDDHEPTPLVPKQRKQEDAVPPSPPQSNQSPVLAQTDARVPTPKSPEIEEGTLEATVHKGERRKVSAAPTDPGMEDSTSSDRISRKKRKASRSPSPTRESQPISKSTISSRTKRVASSVKGVGAETSGKGNNAMNVSTRATRSRKR